MNIFKSLSQGNGRISETNITSFFSYLLNSSNELSNSFVLLFFDLLDGELKENKLVELLQLKLNFRDRIIEFTKKYEVLSFPEYSLNSRKQIVDIFLKITLKESDQDIAYFLIENKIKKEALNPDQLQLQFVAFKNSEDCILRIPIYSILMTTDDPLFTQMYSKGKLENPNTVWLKWTNRIGGSSIELLLRKLVILEQNAEIHPINPYTQFIIKSFIDYIATEYSYKEPGSRNLSFNGMEVLSSAIFELDGKNYYLKRFENQAIRIFDMDDNLVNEDVKPFLRKINDSYSFKIPLKHPGGRLKTTQALGREIIYALNL